LVVFLFSTDPILIFIIVITPTGRSITAAHRMEQASMAIAQVRISVYVEKFHGSPFVPFTDGGWAG